MKTAEKIILELLGQALFRAEPTLPTDMDWKAVYEEAKRQAVTLTVYRGLTSEQSKSMSEEEWTLWHEASLQVLWKNEMLFLEQKAVLQALHQVDIPFAILKGSSSACNYLDPTARTMGDVDILVRPEQQMEAVRVLQGIGYGEVWDENHYCHMTLERNNIMVEVHKEPNGLYLNGDAELAAKFSAFFADAVDRRQWTGDLPILADDQQAVVLLLHKLEHLTNVGFGLRQLSDWAAFVDRRLTPTLWETLEPRLEEFGLLHFTGIMTRVCVDYLHLPEEKATWAMEYDAELASEVLESILRSGNFGVDGTEYGTRYFVTAQTSGRISGLWKSLLYICRQHWPVCAKYPVLLLIAPFVIYGKYLKLHKEGKRPKFNVVKAYQSAGPKQKLFQELKPFMTGK